jgi:hypothetical protein
MHQRWSSRPLIARAVVFLVRAESQEEGFRRSLGVLARLVIVCYLLSGGPRISDNKLASEIFWRRLDAGVNS